MLTYRNNETENDKNIERVEASVKWYSPTKGYGFLNRVDNSHDIMIHFSALDKVGCGYIKTGDRVICEIAPGKCGLQVVRVIEVKFGSSEPRSLSGFLSSQGSSFDVEDLEEIKGVIKWYNPDKGYGFIISDDGRKEIFLHQYVLRAAGHKFLTPGIRVLAKVSNSERGQEARMLTVIYVENEKQIAM